MFLQGRPYSLAQIQNHRMTSDNLMLRIFAITTSIFLSGQMSLAAPEPVQLHNSNAVWFENWVGLSNATMTVTTPSGEMVEIFAASGTPVFQLSGRQVLDGVYSFELRAATDEARKIVNPIDQGRGNAQRDSVAVPFYYSGHFVVERGIIITPETLQEE